MMREIDEAMMTRQQAAVNSPSDGRRSVSPQQPSKDTDNVVYEVHKKTTTTRVTMSSETAATTSNSRDRAHAALKSRRTNSSSTMPPHHPVPVAPEDEDDELDLPESPSRSEDASDYGGVLGIATTNYGRAEDVDHTAGSDFAASDIVEDPGPIPNNNSSYSDTFDVDVHPQEFGPEDEDESPRSQPRSSPTFGERQQEAAVQSASPSRSSSTSFAISIDDLELLGARELSLASVSSIEPTVNTEAIVSAGFRDAVRAEEAKLRRQRCIDFVSFRKELGHDATTYPLRNLDDILAEVVISQEIALDKLELGNYDGAMSSFMAIVTKCEDGTYSFADERVQDQLTGTIMHNMAVIHMQLEVFDVTPQLWDEACMTLRDSNPELGIFQHSVATSLNEMGMSLCATRDLEKAIRAFADVIYVRQEIHGINNAPLAQAINNIGVVHFAMGSIDNSLEAFDEALQVYRMAMLAESEGEGDTSNDDSNVTAGPQTLLLGIATTLTNVAYVRATQGACAEAREALGEAVEIQEAVLEPDNPRIQMSLALLKKISAFEDVRSAPSDAFDPFNSFEV